MAFVVYKTVDGAREVQAVFRAQTQANQAASRDADLTAFTGSVNDKVQPGDFINTTGSILPSVPVAVQDTRTGVSDRARAVNAWRAFNDAMRDNVLWRSELGTDNHADAVAASYRWAWSAVAVIDQLLVAGSGRYLNSLSRADRSDMVEHIAKELEDDQGDAYFRFLALSKSARDNWAGTNVASGQTIYTDLISGSTARDPDGAYTSTGRVFPAKFDASRSGLRRN